MRGTGTLLLALFLGVVFAWHCQAARSFYVDPDWPGPHIGTPARPWNALNATAWSAINAALANGDVTIYFSALKAHGVTQQSRPWFVQCRRTNYGPHRLTLDGYAFYNSNETTPNWLANPDNDISHAYLNRKVFKIVGGDNPIDSNMALGWTRVDVGANDFVTHNGLVYCCIESHLASSDNEPGVGANWRLYWDQHGTSGAPAWSSGTTYKCYVKQNNITLRGFEITGRRSQVSGDNLIWEYIWIHDTVLIGPGLHLNYTSYPDSSAAQIVSRPSTNLIFRNFRIERTYGEGFYLGSINPDAPATFQLAHGNQHSHILIENFLIDHPGVNGGQGDGIDCKNGITYLTIRSGEIRGYGRSGNGINLPYSATNKDQHNLVERVFIHGSNHDNLNAQRCIQAETGGSLSTSLYGLVGLTIRNCICANSYSGIVVAGSTGQPADQIRVFNNTVYGITNIGLNVTTNITNSQVKNNFVSATGSATNIIASSGVVSDYNAHDGAWTSTNEGTHTLSLTRAQALAALVDPVGGNFHLSPRAPVIGRALVQTSFSDDYSGLIRGPSWDIGGFQATRSESDFDNDGYPDLVLYNGDTRQTVVWYMNGNVHVGGSYGPTVLPGWQLIATADFNRDGHPDYLLFNPATRATAIWYMNNNVRIGHAAGPPPWFGWSLLGVADFNGEGKPDYLLYNPITRQTMIWYLDNNVLIGHAAGPTLWSGWSLLGVADFNGEGKPDYLLYNPITRQTMIWYLDNNVLIGHADGPTLWSGWSLVAP